MFGSISILMEGGFSAEVWFKRKMYNVHESVQKMQAWHLYKSDFVSFDKT